MHSVTVAVFEGPAPSFDDFRNSSRRPDTSRPTVSSTCGRDADAPRTTGLGRQSRVRRRFPRAAHGHSRADASITAEPGRTDHVATSRPRQTALGTLDGVGSGRRHVGRDLQGSPRHDRRRVGHRPTDAGGRHVSSFPRPGADAVGPAARSHPHSRSPPVRSRASRSIPSSSTAWRAALPGPSATFSTGPRSHDHRTSRSSALSARTGVGARPTSSWASFARFGPPTTPPPTTSCLR